MQQVRSEIEAAKKVYNDLAMKLSGKATPQNKYGELKQKQLLRGELQDEAFRLGEEVARVRPSIAV